MKFEVLHKWVRRTMITLSLLVGLSAIVLIGCGTSSYTEVNSVQRESISGKGELIALIDKASIYRIKDGGTICYLAIRRGYAPAISCLP